MARAHIRRPIQDNSGNLITDATVAVYEPGGTTEISQDLLEASSGVDTRDNPFEATDGHVDFYLETPEVVRIGITRPSLPDTFIEDVAIGDPDEEVREPTIQSVFLKWQGNLVATTEMFRWVVPEDGTLIDVRASVAVAPTGSSAIIDVLKGGTSLWDANPANRPTIAASGDNAVGGTPDSSDLTTGDELLPVIDQHGSTLPGVNLLVVIRWQADA